MRQHTPLSGLMDDDFVKHGSVKWYVYQEPSGSVCHPSSKGAKYWWFDTKAGATAFGIFLFRTSGGLYSIGDVFDFYKHDGHNIEKIG